MRLSRGSAFPLVCKKYNIFTDEMQGYCKILLDMVGYWYDCDKEVFMQSDMLAPWKERIKRDVSIIDDVVWAQTGCRLKEELRTVLVHQLERLVLDVVIVTIQEEAEK